MNNFYREVGKLLGEAILREKADLLNIYVERENELMVVAGFDLKTLINKLKNGYTIESPKENNSTPHLINCACSDDWTRGMRDEPIKPPLGVMPRDIWNRKRQKELADAMQRYLEAGKSIPREWIDEYNELSDWGGV